MRSYTKFPKRLGKKIKKLRSNLDLTQEDLAEKIEVSAVYLGYIEQGRNTPSLQVLQKLAKALKIPISQLLE